MAFVPISIATNPNLIPHLYFCCQKQFYALRQHAHKLLSLFSFTAQFPVNTCGTTVAQVVPHVSQPFPGAMILVLVIVLTG